MYPSQAKIKNNIKVRWDFGDGKKSTKINPTHTYKKTGTYIGTVKVTSPIETVMKQFDIKIKKYAKKKIRITHVMPNPKGKDSGNEYIIIKNESKKKIKLKNWSIATGKDSDSLKNHPFKKTIILKKGASKKITKKHAAISLPNTFGFVEVRLPDGRKIDDVSYDYEHAKTIPENAMYEKIKSDLQWSNEKNKEVNNGNTKELSDDMASKIIAQARENMKSQTQKDLRNPTKKQSNTQINTNQKIQKDSVIHKIFSNVWALIQNTYSTNTQSYYNINHSQERYVCLKGLEANTVVDENMMILCR